MIEHEMLFLGLLLEGPRHGYDIKRQIQDELRPYVSLNVKSVYYPLRLMERRGLVHRSGLPEGKGPTRYVYAITAAGQQRFQQLLTESFLSIERPFFRIDLSLYFLKHVDQATAARRLRARIGILRRIAQQLQGDVSAANPAGRHFLILRHDLDLVEAEIASLGRVQEGLAAAGEDSDVALLTKS